MPFCLHAAPAVLAGFLVVHLANDVATNLALGLRWVHFVSGIGWIGLGYFLVLAGLPWQNELDVATRGKAAPLMRRAWWWLRWSSVVAVLAGLWLWMMEVGADSRAAGQSGSTLIWSFFGLWTAAFVIYMGVMMSPARVLRRGPVRAVITAVLVIAASYGFLRLNAHGWETNRALAIGIGGGIGWFMWFNLWGLIWRIEKRLIERTALGQVPAEAARMMELAVLGAKTNVWLSLPMLFFMAVASHYPLLGRWT